MKGESVASPRSADDKNRLSILRKAFDVYDADGSGSIDYSEFKRLIQDLGWPAHEEFIDRAVRVLDQDMSGEIEFSEFQKWTEFAYASRILYRQEMYGLGPRSSSVDNVDMQPVIDEAHDGKKALVIRRASLTTVFEEKEDAEQEKYRSYDAPSGSSDEEENGKEGRHGLVFCSSSSGNAGDRDRNTEPTSSFMLRLCHRKSSPSTPFRDSNNCASPLPRPERGSDESSEAQCQDVVDNEGMLFDDKNILCTRNIDVPIREMATMLLSTGRKSRRIHTSRSRARSVGIFRSRRSGIDGDSHEGEKSDDGIVLGPRTESKMTVRMRFACGQFEGQEGERNEHSLTNSQSFGGSGSESGEELRSDELSKCKETGCSKSKEASAAHRRGNVCIGGDEDGRTKSSVDWKDGDADDRNRDTE